MGRPSVKEQLVDRTLGVWIERGFEGASVNDLVAAAGVPKGSFYNHFSSKEQFAVEHVNRYVHTLALEALANSPGRAVDAVRDHFVQLVASRRDGRMAFGCLLGTFSNSVTGAYPELQEALHASFGQWVDALTAALSRARDAGELSTDRAPADLAAALVDGFEGAVARSRVAGALGPLDQFLAVSLEELTR